MPKIQPIDRNFFKLKVSIMTTQNIHKINYRGEELRVKLVIYIAMAVVSTAAIAGTRAMTKIEPDNTAYVWYAVVLNFLMIALCALAS